MCRRPTTHWIPLILIISLAGLLSGCAPTTLKPPAEPEDSVTVAVLDHGRHSSLVLPAEPAGRWLRYSYGDWSFYVERNTGPGAMLAAVFASTRAALGRQELEGADLNAAVRAGLRVPLEDIHHIEVPATRAQELLEQLEAIWEAGADGRVDSAAWGMSFVGHPDAYTLRHNSNRVVAQWLESLDVEVSKKPVLSNWQVERP